VAQAAVRVVADLTGNPLEGEIKANAETHLTESLKGAP
jgi:hypothetical protein